MKYCEVNYKYRQAEDDETHTRIIGYRCHTDLIDLYEDGRMVFRKNYCWDGCSGPTWDDKTNMVPGRNHDGKYQFLRLGQLPQSVRCIADEELKVEILERSAAKTKNPIKKKFYELRAWYYYEGVDHGAAYAARYGTEPKILEAP